MLCLTGKNDHDQGSTTFIVILSISGLLIKAYRDDGSLCRSTSRIIKLGD